MTGTSEEAQSQQKFILNWIPCIDYPVQFQKHKVHIQVLIDSGSEVNPIIPSYIFKLDLEVWTTNVGATKIDNSLLKTFGMVIAGFQVKDKLDNIWFFQESFLLGNINMEVVLRMPFLILSNANI